MTDKEAIKYLQQLYFGGSIHRLDEQQIEAIGMAVKAFQEEPKDWLQELQEKLDSLSKEDFEKVWAKYKLREEGSADYVKLNAMLDDALSKETKESWNERLGEEEPISEGLEEASKEWLRPQLDKSYAAYGETKQMELTHFDGYAMLDAIEFGAKWQKNHLWKPADGEDLPEIDMEVIVLTQSYPLEGSEFAVSFAHRPDPKGWDGKSITTGKVEHYTPKTYDKGGWNIPDVRFWLDVKLPKEIEL